MALYDKRLIFLLQMILTISSSSLFKFNFLVNSSSSSFFNLIEFSATMEFMFLFSSGSRKKERVVSLFESFWNLQVLLLVILYFNVIILVLY